MGLDLSLINNYCKHCYRSDEVGIYSYTYNVSRMWYEIYPDDKHMVPIEGMTGKKASEKLKYALKIMEEKPELFIKHNPENGWGSYEGFIEFLKKLLLISEANQTGIWSAWR